MEHLKRFNESLFGNRIKKKRTKYNKQDVKDICLDLTDNGFNIRFREMGKDNGGRKWEWQPGLRDKTKFNNIVISKSGDGSNDNVLQNFFFNGEVKDVVLRLIDYLGKDLIDVYISEVTSIRFSYKKDFKSIKYLESHRFTHKIISIEIEYKDYK